MREILILSASVGAGHMRAAQAVELAARALYPDANVVNLDVLSLTNAAFRRLYGKAYLDLVNKAPHVLGYMYDLLDSKPVAKSDRLLHLVQKANLRELLEQIRSRPWDVIINTHFLPAEIIAREKLRGRLDVPHVTVTTDFETHRLWYNEPCERYFTATEEGAGYLASFGVDPGRIQTTGIPIHPAFAKLPSRASCLKTHDLDGDRPVLLQLAGGFGVGPIRKVHEAILELKRPVQLVTICGRNKACLQELEAVACPERHRRKLVGFTDVMHEFMAAADLVISKPGGLTSSEALAAGAAMVIINPIPGQESRNSDYLLEEQAAIKANNLPTLSYKLAQLLDDAARLRQLKNSARRIGHPRAAFEIVESAAMVAKGRRSLAGKA